MRQTGDVMRSTSSPTASSEPPVDQRESLLSRRTMQLVGTPFVVRNRCDLSLNPANPRPPRNTLCMHLPLHLRFCHLWAVTLGSSSLSLSGAPFPSVLFVSNSFPASRDQSLLMISDVDVTASGEGFRGTTQQFTRSASLMASCQT